MITVERTGGLIAEEVFVAESFSKRLMGLMFRGKMSPLTALVIRPCNSIHTFFMRFPIDVLFVSKDSEVVAILHGIKPWRLSKIYLNSRFVVELPEGSALRSGIRVGDKIFFSQIAKRY